MPLSEQQRVLVEQFRKAVGEALADDPAFAGPVERHDREDASTLALRWPAGPHVWYELSVRPYLPQVRVGILTDDRWRSEDFEQMIEDSGDTMQEFVELGFESAGLSIHEPAVEHYRDQGKYFYFATPIELTSLDQLAEAAFRDQTVKMLRGYHLAFSGQTR